MGGPMGRREPLSLAYLASPYSHADEAVREQRFRIVCKVAAALMQAGEVVFSPIAHSHPIAEAKPGPWAVDHDFWLRQDAPYLYACTKLYVLMLDGWERSRGVAHEVDVARSRGIDIVYLDPELFA